jgi:hypothetical protein
MSKANKCKVSGFYDDGDYSRNLLCYDFVHYSKIPKFRNTSLLPSSRTFKQCRETYFMIHKTIIKIVHIE